MAGTKGGQGARVSAKEERKETKQTNRQQGMLRKPDSGVRAAMTGIQGCCERKQAQGQQLVALRGEREKKGTHRHLVGMIADEKRPSVERASGSVVLGALLEEDGRVDGVLFETRLSLGREASPGLAGAEFKALTDVALGHGEQG